MTETHAGGAATATATATPQGLAEVRFPQLGESVIEGTVLQWLVKEGDTVKEDDLLVEIETEKVVAEIPSPFAGTLHSYAVEIGQTVPVGTVLMYIAEAGATSTQVAAMPETTGAVVPLVTRDLETDTLTAAMTAATMDAPTSGASQTATDDASQTATNGTSNSATNGVGDTVMSGNTAAYIEAADAAVRYSPAVRKLAKEFALDPAAVKGTGAGGRVTRDDMMRAHAEVNTAQQAPVAEATAITASVPVAPPVSPPAATAILTPAVPAPTPGTRASESDTGDLIPMTTLRRRTAEALVRAAQTIPQAATWAEADVTDLVRRRDREKDAFRAREGVPLTYLPFFVQAALAAIRQYPVVSSQWTDEGIRLKRNVGMGIAVSTDDGLVAPVIHNAGDYSITGLARILDEKIRRARAGKLTLNDIQGGTITLTNPGSFGSLRTLALVRPGEAAMYSVDAIIEKPVVRNGGIAIRSIVTIGVSFDHRIFDGREAVLFLNAVKEWLETQAANVSL